MALGNFDACFAVTERYEGWRRFSDDPRDPGGATWCGVTQRAYDVWRRDHGLGLRPVRRADDDEIRAIARDEYWTPVRGDECFAGLDLALFDIAFNSGPLVAVRFLQRALGVSADGAFGLETRAALLAAKDRAAIIRAVCARRIGFWRSLRTWGRFGRGWSARGRGVEAMALAMLAQKR